MIPARLADFYYSSAASRKPSNRHATQPKHCVVMPAGTGRSRGLAPSPRLSSARAALMPRRS
jgi:hypothetical protein